MVPLFPGAEAALEAVGPSGCGGDEPLVRRRDLFERLARAGRVTIVAAPAGSGKTWLLRSWVADAGLAPRTAWATVAHDERDGQRFWSSVIDALDGIAGVNAGRVNGEPRGETLTERLLRTLQRIDEPAVLVIDDLHELQSDDAVAGARALPGRPAREASRRARSRAGRRGCGCIACGWPAVSPSCGAPTCASRCRRRTSC